ncbi:MAG: aminobenzoyl-glutamate utilization protein [Alphaproteobacteria bacterium]|jgi:aminobenzoyl-glutamate utilization protein B|nr:aminobenzoyl-glutamate utilization protein [Alphaproteobacteria bacterium]
MTARGNLTAEQSFLFDYVERNARAIATLGDSIFYFGELGMQEFETAKLMSGLLEKAGFRLERGISGFPTGFCASYGSGQPVVAIHTEYDSCPDNSQAAGVPKQQFIVEGAPGHCEGHNVNAAVLVATALAVKAAMDEFGLKGTLKVFGAPAEEQLVSRPYFVRDGWFDDVDVSFHDHIGSEFSSSHGLLQSALVSATFTFHGETAHAGTSPWNGRDALDGVMLMDAGMAQYREHMRPSMRVHRVITNGGDQPNVIPRVASIWWFFRDGSAEGAQALFDQAKKIAAGAAMMSNTTVEVDVLSAVWPLRCNRTLAELVQRNIEVVGMPAWTDDEDRLARALQGNAKVKVEGLRREIKLMKGETVPRTSANDAGDVSWKVPMAKFYYPANVPNINSHHWGAGVVLATSIAHKGAVAGAKAFAAAVTECFTNPAVVAEAKRTFEEELGGVEYKSMLPADQKPPVELNRTIMDKFRPAMREHYLKETPEFT